jgi:hypothetical protein
MDGPTGEFDAPDASLSPTEPAELLAMRVRSQQLEGQLAELLSQQAATAEILRLVSQAHMTAQPVFESIATAALRLCRATIANLFTFDGQLLHIAALAHANPEGVAAIQALYPRPPGRDMVATRVVLTRGIVHMPDMLQDPDYAFPDVASALGFRGGVGVPLMRGGEPIG